MAKDRDEHYYDAQYEVWRMGGNVDHVDYYESETDFNNGELPEHTANKVMRRDTRNYLDDIKKWGTGLAFFVF